LNGIDWIRHASNVHAAATNRQALLERSISLTEEKAGMIRFAGSKSGV
jgi:hypothetical protein